jgi:hypothetical protein
MNRINVTVSIQKSPSGKYMAIVADHGEDLPGSDGADIRVAKIEQPSAEELAILVSSAILGAIRDNEAGAAIDNVIPFHDPRN